MNLQTPLFALDRIFKMYKSRLEKLGVITVEDLLYYIPYRYEDFSLISPIAKLQIGEMVTIQGKIQFFKNEFTRNYKKIQKAIVEDDTGSIEVIWFNQPFLANTMHVGDTISLSGKVTSFNNKLSLESPEYEIISPQNPVLLHTGRLVPIYPETKGISSKWIRRQVRKMLDTCKQNVLEYIPDSIIKNLHAMSLFEALENVHFPQNYEVAKKAKFRLAFDELFLLQLASLKRRQAWQEKKSSFAFSILPFKTQIEIFFNNLPFELTSAQKKAVDEITKDLTSTKPMNRLLEGDVGSGKTVVAAIAMYIAYLNGYQSVLMAPTEILANQHFATISTLLSPLGVKIQLVTSSSKHKVSRSKKKNKEKILNTKYLLPDTDILIGTHALLHDSVRFDTLGLVVIDEQQRFGVAQRAIIRDKGSNPHLLTMTATPIPRTVALTMYGDLDLSYLDEMPKGRKLIKTWLVPSEKRTNAYNWIRKQIQETQSQVFIICPFIEESESMATVKAATKEFERLQKEVFPDLKLGLLHGKQKSKEKDAVLQDFKNKKFSILVATPVVEVGIDISNATIIVIEASERFGLSQLHQLRGRVGRGEKQSYCLLFTENKTQQTSTRLKSLETTHNGARLAEIDLQLRGAGDIYGTKQHGISYLKIASFSDFPLIERAKREAEIIFPELNNYPLLKGKVDQLTILQVSPD